MVEIAPFVMVVLIVAIVTYARTQRARYQHSAAVDDGPARIENDRMREEVRALRDRIAVLERIVTDGDRNRGMQLEREIEALRDGREGRP